MCVAFQVVFCWTLKPPLSYSYQFVFRIQDRRSAMSKRENNFEALESIIKVEPEQFQEIIQNRRSLRSNGSISKSKNEKWVFSGIKIEKIIFGFVFSFSIPAASSTLSNSGPKADNTQLRKKSDVEILSESGNKGRHPDDSHTCCFCRNIFSNRSVLESHLKNFHLKTKNLCCDICDFKTAFQNDLKKHKLTHPQILVECTVCGKKVRFLNRHMRLHKPKVPCPACKKAVSQSGLKRHLMTHSDNGIKCENCSDIFETKEDLRRFDVLSSATFL